MKGFKVVQCITLIVSIYALFMAAVCPKDQKKTEPDHAKTCLKGFSDQAVLKLKHAQYYKKQLEF